MSLPNERNRRPGWSADHPAGRPDPGRISTRDDFGRELTLARDRAGLSVRDVARRVGIQHSTAGGYFSGRHLPALKPPTLLTDILLVCGVTEAGELAEWSEALRRVRRTASQRWADIPTPYRGLASYRTADADWFFGREPLTRTVLERLGSSPERGLLMVVGASGSGKSSLLQAGLIPLIQAGAVLPGSQRWTCRLFTPGAQPLVALARQLESIRPDSGQVDSGQVDSGPGGGRVLLIVDQFEEVFTACRTHQEQAEFVAALQALGRSGRSPESAAVEPGLPAPTRVPGTASAIIIIGMRSDFYSAAVQHPALAAALQDAQVVVGPMSEVELRQAIVEPSRSTTGIARRPAVQTCTEEPRRLFKTAQQAVE